MATLEQAFQFRCQHFFQLHAANLCLAFTGVRIGMNEEARLDREIDFIELCNVQSNTDYNGTWLPVEILEVQLGFVDLFVFITALLFSDYHPVLFKNDPSGLLNEIRYSAQLAC